MTCRVCGQRIRDREQCLTLTVSSRWYESHAREWHDEPTVAWRCHAHCAPELASRPAAQLSVARAAEVVARAAEIEAEDQIRRAHLATRRAERLAQDAARIAAQVAERQRRTGRGFDL